MVRDAEHLGASYKIREIHLPLVRAEVAHGDFHHRDNVLSLHGGAPVFRELGPGLVDHVQIDPSHWGKAPPLEQHGPLT